MQLPINVGLGVNVTSIPASNHPFQVLQPLHTNLNFPCIWTQHPSADTVENSLICSLPLFGPLGRATYMEIEIKFLGCFFWFPVEACVCVCVCKKMSLWVLISPPHRHFPSVWSWSQISAPVSLPKMWQAGRRSVSHIANKYRVEVFQKCDTATQDCFWNNA